MSIAQTISRQDNHDSLEIFEMFVTMEPPVGNGMAVNNAPGPGLAIECASKRPAI